LKRKRVMRSMPFDLSLRDALGERLRVMPDECATYAIAGRVPKSVALPRDAQEASHALASASAEGAIVAIRGAGTKAGRPPAPRSIDVVVGTAGLAGVVEHAAADLTLTVGAGATLAKVEQTLAAAGQFWPCDAPFAQSATIGGTIAANANGALRLRYGALRDVVLGASILTSEGVALHTGSRVVKSVAGYDLHKLLIGSFGTLGLIVDVTLKVSPIPGVQSVAVARFASALAACAVGRQIAASPLFPMAITLHDEPSSRRVGALLPYAARGTWLLLVRCGGNKRSVDRQVDDVTAACKAGGAEATGVLDHAASGRAWSDVRELSGGAAYAGGDFAVVKIVSLPTQTASSISDLRDDCPSAEVSAQPASGIVFAHFDVGKEADARRSLDAFFDRCRRSGRQATLTSAPPGFGDDASVARTASTPVRLVRAVKAAFDPSGVLDPGRLPGGV
jgi:glycolate oxidase FAD binding subunit